MEKLIKSREAVTRTNCHHSQCYGFSKRGQQRCRLCVNKDSAAKPIKMCWRHVFKDGAPEPFHLNRRGLLPLGFDPKLMTDNTLWFADDALDTALKIFHVAYPRTKYRLGLFTQGGRHILYGQGPHEAEKKHYALVLLYAKHWFILIIEPKRAYILDSLGDYINKNAAARSFVGKIVHDYNNVLTDVLYDPPYDLLMQPNENDCGAYVILFLAHILRGQTNKIVNWAGKSSDTVRKAVVEMLITHNSQALII